jgi:ABC-type amino acid transport system permease subunit
MVKYVIGAVGALLGVLAGAWLMLTPFALAYQNSGADWAEPTYVDFWTGLPLLVGLILYVSGLVEELRRRGIMRRPYAEPAGQPQARVSLRTRPLVPRTTWSRSCCRW